MSSIIPARAVYGALAALRLAQHYTQGLLQAKDIVARDSTPRFYLEQILNRLMKAGLVQSVRGARGGFRLARPPAEVSLLQVLEALEGRTTILGTPCNAPALEELFGKAEEGLRDAFDVSLQDLCQREEERHGTLHFHI